MAHLCQSTHAEKIKMKVQYMVIALIKCSRPTIMLDYESKYLKAALKILKKGSFMVKKKKVLPFCKIQDL